MFSFTFVFQPRGELSFLDTVSIQQVSAAVLIKELTDSEFQISFKRWKCAAPHLNAPQTYLNRVLGSDLQDRRLWHYSMGLLTPYTRINYLFEDTWSYKKGPSVSSAIYSISSSFTFDFRYNAPPTEEEAETFNTARVI